MSIIKKIDKSLYWPLFAVHESTFKNTHCVEKLKNTLQSQYL